MGELSLWACLIILLLYFSDSSLPPGPFRDTALGEQRIFFKSFENPPRKFDTL